MSDQTPGTMLQTLLVSVVRFSAGVALFGLDQAGKIGVGAVGGNAKAAATLATAFDTVSNSLADGMNETARNALKSVSRVAAKAISKTAEALSGDTAGGGGDIRSGGRFGQCAVTATASSNYESPGTSPTSPQLAIDVLTGRRDP